VCVCDAELAIGNVVRHVLFIIRDEFVQLENAPPEYKEHKQSESVCVCVCVCVCTVYSTCRCVCVCVCVLYL